jgi:hypothetical protein
VIWLGSHASIGKSVHLFVSVFPAILIHPRAFALDPSIPWDYEKPSGYFLGLIVMNY